MRATLGKCRLLESSDKGILAPSCKAISVASRSCSTRTRSGKSRKFLLDSSDIKLKTKSVGEILQLQVHRQWHES